MYSYTSQRVSGSRVCFFQRLLSTAAIAISAALGAGHAWAAPVNVSAGTTPSSVPNAFLDMKTHEIQGVMPDVIRAIGKREGFDVSFDVIPFSAVSALRRPLLIFARAWPMMWPTCKWRVDVQGPH
ncbi:type 2 periplasmic-binding domain-containing protein [Paraburkholderia franconis]|uniref:hypothetical protein n=1 Tax=Paraburkholderia franconis TaxID=2654983 RepID=UPI001D12AB4F|nr:hypothetical protein [Paraburkholderia franconis]